MYSHSEELGERDESGFFAVIDKIALEVKKRDDFVVVFHYDADGCASGAIAVKALEREGKKVATLCLKQLYKENIPQITALGKNYLFVDFGSGQLDYLKQEFNDDFFVLDHHQPCLVDGKVLAHKFHANPLLFGINGGTELSGAGVTFFFANALNEKNKDLSVLAIVGACGDMQESRGALEGLNRKIMQIAEEEKLLSVKKDLRLFGRISRPLVSFLCFSSNPILPQLTANEENCVAFIKGLGIPLKDPFTERYLSYEDLSLDQKRSLSSALIMHLSNYGVEEWKIKELIGEVYTLEKEKEKSPLRDAKEFATALNSAGRHKQPNVALNVCMGDRNPSGEYGNIIALLDEHRAALRNGIEFIHNHGISERKTFYFFDAKDQIEESLVGIIAGMLYGSVIQENKPIIALARNSDGTVKASGRGTSALLRRGLNIGAALKEIGLVIPGVEGGGHKIAAGAKIPSDKVEEFLDLLEKKFESQLKN
ncbi:MAG: DHH family phosphoesterase [archaeon]|jgi:RecJ-like exonuclease